MKLILKLKQKLLDLHSRHPKDVEELILILGDIERELEPPVEPELNSEKVLRALDAFEPVPGPEVARPNLLNDREFQERVAQIRGEMQQ